MRQDELLKTYALIVLLHLLLIYPPLQKDYARCNSLPITRLQKFPGSLLFFVDELYEYGIVLLSSF